MKKIYSTLVLLLSLFSFASCDDDRDSNPTLAEPTEFILNTPKYVSGIYDLKNTESIQLTCTQPDYGFTAAATYSVQIAVESNFSNYTTLGTTYNTAAMEVNAKEVAVALVGLLEVEEAENYPKDIFPVFVRLESKLSNGTGKITSNIIELPKVKGYFALDDMVMPENMYVIGNVAGNWDWTKSIALTPVNSTEGKFWGIVYLGETTGGDKAEIKFNWEKSWDIGENFGMKNSIIDDASKELAGISGEDNIKIGNSGWYLVVVKVEIEGRSYKYNVQFLAPNIYLIGGTVGGWDILDSNLFTVPTTVDGEFVSPAFTVADELRMCVKLEGQEWWHTEFIIANGEIDYRGTGGDQDRVKVAAGKKAYLKFSDGTGYIQ
ncbi:SusF/SusE family outer membrane protein [Bacteroides sp. 519]|uniref:SusF/SusE family outer membrane protein n=1 Tax=Bacteroides sp. 519 TaxID=2302937 RepID=UPI0013D5B5CA|nr:SusF/SusE family outer membrane protein [Bacteroides sp. 519]NDV56973.1 SusF/SusE family outer membrane protein [Bacteroides sp. 519]